MQRKLYQPFANGYARLELDVEHPDEAINESFMDVLNGFASLTLYIGLINGANQVVAKHGKQDGGITSVKQTVHYTAGDTIVEVRGALKVRATVRQSKLIGLLSFHLQDLHALVDFIEDEIEHTKEPKNVFSDVLSMFPDIVGGDVDMAELLKGMPPFRQDRASSCGDFALGLLNGNHDTPHRSYAFR